MSLFLWTQVALAPFAVYAAYSWGRLTWLRRRADRCEHVWSAGQCSRCRLMKGQRGT